MLAFTRLGLPGMRHSVNWDYQWVFYLLISRRLASESTSFAPSLHSFGLPELQCSETCNGFMIDLGLCEALNNCASTCVFSYVQILFFLYLFLVA